MVKNPIPGVKEALIIAGSDKRGTIYGIYDLSEKIGVSPWHFWADVPAKKHEVIFVNKEKYTLEEPKVKYRGIFLNDEAPCLSGWTHETNGGFNQKLYTKVFDLILRLKGNYLWPAMWGNAFHVDDPMNPILADAYGVVIGTSHHEPLMRAHDEWRRYGRDKGPWDYAKNDSTLRAFWKESVEQRYQYENIFSMGMRGDGDEPMSRETATNLLEKIVADQRAIIEEVSGKPASAKPQLWALYKEVQDYYDQGMRVDDDITLLLCDDNWGNIRKLPDLDAPKRKGGFGIYYHFDYVGGPRNYKWVNTNPIPRIWEQMHLAYEYNAREIWIVNVGDLKPMEHPISFFLDYAWNPEAMPMEKMEHYSQNWAEKTFGATYAEKIGYMLDTYAKLNGRRKPELLDANTYSLENYNEWENVVEEFRSLRTMANETYEQLPAVYKDAYYQLVLYPILATANLNELYYAHAQNKHSAANGYTDTNMWADMVEATYKKDQELSDYFNHTLLNGKWNHFADQTHIGYTYWQQPNQNSMPKIKRLSEDQMTSTPPAKAPDAKVEIPKTSPNFQGFVAQDGYVSMDAANFTAKTDGEEVIWKVIPNIGRTADGVSTYPVTKVFDTLSVNNPSLAYSFYLTENGSPTVTSYLSPTLEFNGNKGLKFAIAIDNEEPQIINIHADRSGREWNQKVAENIKKITSRHPDLTAGEHVLKIWAIDPAVIYQKFVIDLGGLKPSYFGPPQSIYIGKSTMN